MNIIAKVQFNKGFALVLDKEPVITYEFLPGHGKTYLVGSNDDAVFYECMVYERPIGRFKAFGGREFDVTMKDGTKTHCDGQYWSGGAADVGRIIGVDLVSVVSSGIDELKRCYVFSEYHADKKKIRCLIEQYHGDVIPYWDYKKMLMEQA